VANLSTNWADVMASMLAKLRELVDEGVIKQTQAGTARDLAAFAPKDFPSIFLEWKGSTIEKVVTQNTSSFAVLYRGHWEVHHFCSTGSTDAVGMFARTGPFYVSCASREKLLGMDPDGQKLGNSDPLSNEQHFLLMPDGEGEIEPLADARGGSGGMRMTCPYWLNQLIGAVGA
jgi:hypothetical protein